MLARSLTHLVTLPRTHSTTLSHIDPQALGHFHSHTRPLTHSPPPSPSPALPHHTHLHMQVAHEARVAPMQGISHSPALSLTFTHPLPHRLSTLSSPVTHAIQALSTSPLAHSHSLILTLIRHLPPPPFLPPPPLTQLNTRTAPKRSRSPS